LKRLFHLVHADLTRVDRVHFAWKLSMICNAPMNLILALGEPG